MRDRAGAAERILSTATTLFKARGYHGTSVRDLAQAVGIEAASVYHYFPSKQKILYDIFNRAMDDLLDGLERALSGATSHEERLRAAKRFHILFHVGRQDEAFISHSELRSLTASNRRRITVKRDRYKASLRAFLAARSGQPPDLRRSRDLSPGARANLRGTYEQDDMDNWEQCTKTCHGVVTARYCLNTQMGLGHEGFNKYLEAFASELSFERAQSPPFLPALGGTDGGRTMVRSARADGRRRQ